LAKTTGPASSNLWQRSGERFFPRQVEQGVEESWEECEHHAALIEKIVPFPAAKPKHPTHEASRAEAVAVSQAGKTDLFGNPLPTDLFGNVIPAKKRRR